MCCLCPADGARRVSSEAGRRAQSQTESRVEVKGGTDNTNLENGLHILSGDYFG